MYLQYPLFKAESLLRPFFLSGSRILHPLSPVKIVSLHDPGRATHGYGIRGNIGIHNGQSPDHTVLPDGHVGKDADIIGQPGPCPDTDRTDLDVLFLKGTIDIPGLSGVVDDTDIRGNPDIVFNDNPMESADDCPFGYMDILPDEQDSLFGGLIPRVNVNVRIPFDPDTVPDVNIAGPDDHHSRLNIDILPVRSEKEPVLEIDERIPESLFLHARTFLSDILSSKTALISLQFLSVECPSARVRAALEASSLRFGSRKTYIFSSRSFSSLGSEMTKPSFPWWRMPLAPLDELVITGNPLAKASRTVNEQAS
jgi:hypothetical protein